VCQVTILVTSDAESWRGLHDQHREFCNVFKLLTISTIFLLVCNTTAILIIDFGHPLVGSSKLKISGAMCLGLVGSTVIWWHSCFANGRPYITLMAVIVIQIFCFTVFIALLAATSTETNTRDQLNQNSSEALKNHCSSLWNVWKEKKRPAFFTTLLLMCLVVIISGSPRSPEQTEVLKTVLYSFIMRFVVGIILPLTFSDLIDSSYKGESE
ncbi:hypothetical protein ACROYT_G042260, partial [Oculina patagonica]